MKEREVELIIISHNLWNSQCFKTRYIFANCARYSRHAYCLNSNTGNGYEYI